MGESARAWLVQAWGDLPLEARAALIAVAVILFLWLAARFVARRTAARRQAAVTRTLSALDDLMPPGRQVLLERIASIHVELLEVLEGVVSNEAATLRRRASARIVGLRARIADAVASARDALSATPPEGSQLSERARLGVYARGLAELADMVLAGARPARLRSLAEDINARLELFADALALDGDRAIVRLALWDDADLDRVVARTDEPA